jgi:hypothetical protein
MRHHLRMSLCCCIGLLEQGAAPRAARRAARCARILIPICGAASHLGCRPQTATSSVSCAVPLSGAVSERSRNSLPPGGSRPWHGAARVKQEPTACHAARVVPAIRLTRPRRLLALRVSEGPRHPHTRRDSSESSESSRVQQSPAESSRVQRSPFQQSPAESSRVQRSPAESSVIPTSFQRHPNGRARALLCIKHTLEVVPPHISSPSPSCMRSASRAAFSAATRTRKARHSVSRPSDIPMRPSKGH